MRTYTVEFFTLVTWICSCIPVNAHAQDKMNRIQHWLQKYDQGEYKYIQPSQKEKKLITSVFGPSGDSSVIEYISFSTQNDQVKLVDKKGKQKRKIVIGKISPDFYFGFLYHHVYEFEDKPFFLSLKDSLILIPIFDFLLEDDSTGKYSFKTLRLMEFMDFKGNVLANYREEACCLDLSPNLEKKEFRPTLYFEQPDQTLAADKEYPLLTILPADFNQPIQAWFLMYKNDRQMDRASLPNQEKLKSLTNVELFLRQFFTHWNLQD